MHYAVHGSLPRKHIVSICVSYSGISALRHFGLSQRSSFHSDPAIGTALRRARGASCIRLGSASVSIDTRCPDRLSPAALRSTPQSATELPRFDGQLMNLGGWLRALRQQEHLLPSDLSFFAKSGAQIQSNGKVAVASAQHALLLHYQLLTQCEFWVVKPPPLGDRFVELYRRVRLGQDGLIRGGASLPATINADKIPEEFADTCDTPSDSGVAGPQAPRRAPLTDGAAGVLQE